MAKPEIITWDWKEQPPWPAVMSALERTYADGPQIFEVETNCDEYSIVVAERTLTPAGAQKWFDEHRYDEV